MTCTQARPLFSPYLDGAVTGKQMRELSQHIESCEGCCRQYVSLRQTQHLLARVGPRKAPADLPLKLRVAISQQAAHSRRRYFEGIRVRFDNALDLFMLPATAGLVAAVVIFVVLMGFHGASAGRQFRRSPDAAHGAAATAVGVRVHPGLHQ